MTTAPVWRKTYEEHRSRHPAKFTGSEKEPQELTEQQKEKNLEIDESFRLPAVMEIGLAKAAERLRARINAPENNHAITDIAVRRVSTRPKGGRWSEELMVSGTHEDKEYTLCLHQRGRELVVDPDASELPEGLKPEDVVSSVYDALRPQTRSLPDWVVRQSRARAEWFRRIAEAAPPELRNILIGREGITIRDVIIGAKPATDFMYIDDRAAAIGRLIESVQPPEGVPEGHLRFVEFPDATGRFDRRFLVNLHALPHIVGHNPDVFGGMGSVLWHGEGELPTIPDARAFIQEGLRHDYHRCFGLLMGFPRDAVDAYDHKSDSDTGGGVIWYHVMEEVKRSSNRKKLWDAYYSGNENARENLRPAVEEMLNEAFEGAKKVMATKIRGGEMLRIDDYYNPDTREAPTWNEIRDYELAEHWVHVGGIVYGSLRAGADSELERYREIREASQIDGVVADLRRRFTPQQQEPERKKLAGPRGRLPR